MPSVHFDLFVENAAPVQARTTCPATQRHKPLHMMFRRHRPAAAADCSIFPGGGPGTIPSLNWHTDRINPSGDAETQAES